MAGRGARWAGDGLHALTLIGTAWSLIATSAPAPTPVAAYDCFSGVPSPSTLLVTLGSSDTDGGAGPSCGGIDGLAPGVALRFDVRQGPRPESALPECYAFETTAVQSLTGVTLDAPSAPSDGAFTGASGAFSSPTEQACTGGWSLELEPPTPVGAEGPLDAPLEAGAATWQLVRRMLIPQAQFCGSTFTTRGQVLCEDAFAVDLALSGDP